MIRSLRTACVISLGFLVVEGFTRQSALAAVTPGALHDYDAGNNPLAAMNEWQNNGSLGGVATAFGGPPVLTLGDPAYYSVPDGGAFGNKTTPTHYEHYSAEIWARRTGTPGPENQIFGVSAVGGVQRIQVVTNEFGGNSESIDLLLRGPGDAGPTFRTDVVGNAFPLDQFMQYVFTWDNTTKDFKIYQNGNNVVFSENIAAMNTTVSADTFAEIFKSNVDEIDARRFSGDISRFRFYDFALTGQQIQDNFDFGNAVSVPALAGDLNGDGFVGQDDLNIVLGDWGNMPPGDPRADPSGDDFVGQDDLNPVLADWGQGTPPVELSAVPEPNTIRLAALAGLAAIPLLLRKRSRP